MSRPILPNSPLAEVVYEVRFQGALTHLAGWGAFQEEVRAEYPKLLVPNAGGRSPWMQPLKFSADDERDSIQIAISSFSTSTKQYPGYAIFQTRFLSLLDLFHKHCPVSTFTHVSLRYINKLPPTFDVVGDNKIFRLHPCLKLTLFGLDGSAGTIQPHLVAEVVKDDVKFRITLVPPSQNTNVEGLRAQAPMLHGIHLDLVGYVDGIIPIKEVKQALGRIHTVVEDGFINMITDEYHRYLKGESNAV